MSKHNAKIELTDLEGKWFIVQSNFPMWLKGKRKSPTFNYKIVRNDKGIYLTDNVEYVKYGKLKSIKGIDTPVDKYNTKFVWRGNGLLSILKSKWEILYFDESKQWAIIFFAKTLLTPEGYDVISRNKKLDTNTEQQILKKLSEFGNMENLQSIPQN